jgi:hypothetical protein
MTHNIDLHLASHSLREINELQHYISKELVNAVEEKVLGVTLHPLLASENVSLNNILFQLRSIGNIFKTSFLKYRGGLFYIMCNSKHEVQMALDRMQANLNFGLASYIWGIFHSHEQDRFTPRVLEFIRKELFFMVWREEEWFYNVISAHVKKVITSVLLIQHQFKQSISVPSYRLCKNRLKREFIALGSVHTA